MLRKAGIAAVAIIMVGALTLQAQFTDDQLAAWQAIAETYYVEGVDEDFMLALMDDPTLQPNRWGFDNQDLIQPGMIAPDFTLFSIYDEPFTLSSYEGNNFVYLITGSWYWPPYLRNWVANNKIAEKFSEFPVVFLDIYGRERHPEATSNEGFVQESYQDRRERAILMLYTLEKVDGGTLPANRHILIDRDGPVDNRLSTYSTVATHLFGGRPQTGIIIDLNGKIIHTRGWQSPEQMDEVLSNVFGLDPGY